jgi:formate-dependent nitrite reductase cytochrome c552 subunit
MENKHTPGPWHDRVNEFGQQCIYNPDTWVATCKTPANARLIAAAPEMHSFIDSVAAKGCEENGEHGPECGECDTCRARTLLNKIG